MQELMHTSTSLPPDRWEQALATHPDRAGKFRLIMDLSFPQGASVNDGISQDLSTLSYVTVDEVAEIATQLGKGALPFKMDIQSAYRLIPVHPQDRVLQGMEWKGKVYVDPRLPFGLRSAPKIFNAVADALCWYLEQARYPLHQALPG